MPMPRRFLPALFGLILAGNATSSAADSEKAVLAQKAQAILKTHCYRCHGEAGAVEGGMNFILDLDRLVQRRKVVAGKPAESSVWKRIANESMPPAEVTARVSEAEKTILKQWIEAGAPGVTDGKARTFLSQANVNDAILADLDKIDRRARRFVRYFTFTHLYNAGFGSDEVQTYRNALSKLVNSLSWHPKIRVPEPIEPTGTVLRIDLRWFMWDAPLWNRILNDYPYGILDDSTTSRAIMVATATRIPAVRGDWFVATASRPPLYHEVLQLPGALGELERQLRVDPAINIAQERVLRVAFNGSGISKNNRILERHDAVHGYYWRTYDFEEVPQNLIDRGILAPDRRNVFAYPLGPGSLESQFQHAGGEAIFSLPNGLQGYFIMNAVNNRIDKAPVAIVSDPKRPDRAVELGVSCMGCHVPGVIAKADQMREHLDKNPRAVPKADYEIAKALYPPKEKSLAQMEEDSKQFLAALEKAGVKLTKNEPVSAMTLRYEADLDAVTAAAEAGLPLEEFQKRIGDSELLSRNLGALRVAGGTVHRPVWVQAFGDVVKEMRIGVLFQANQLSGALPDNTGDVDPLEVTLGQSNHMAFSADGRRAVIASADRSVRYYETEGRRDLKRFIGHTASVWSVALSRDGKLALSGSMDGTVRLWRTEDGQQLQKMEGHASLVTAVAFAPDAKTAISGSFDGATILWDLEKGRELRRYEGKARYVNALAVAPDGKHALIGADRIIVLWDFEKGIEARIFGGHTAAVAAVAFSADGKQAASGGDDRTVRLWEVATGKQLLQFNGHESHVKAVAFNESGKWLLSGGADASVRLWQTATGKELGVFRKHTEPVVQVAFLDNGKQTLTGSRDTALLLWGIDKFYPAAPPAKDPAYGKDPAALKPNAVIPVYGTVGKLILSPNRKWLYYYDRSNGTLGQIDTSTFKQTKDFLLPGGVDALTLTRDGKTLYAAGHGDGRSKGGILLEIDALRLRPRLTSTPAQGAPFDVAATDDGRVFLSIEGGEGGVYVLDEDQERVTNQTNGGGPQALLAMSPDQSWVFGSVPGLPHGKLMAVRTGFEKGNPLVSIDVAGTADRPISGEPLVTPDGKYILLKSGTVLRIGSQKDNDFLKPAAKLDPFLAAAVDSEAGMAVIVTPTGWVKWFNYPSWEVARTHKLPATAYHAALDGKAGRLYLSVMDPLAVQARPRSKGFGDIWMVELKDLPKQ